MHARPQSYKLQLCHTFFLHCMAFNEDEAERRNFHVYKREGRLRMYVPYPTLHNCTLYCFHSDGVKLRGGWVTQIKIKMQTPLTCARVGVGVVVRVCNGCECEETRPTRREW